MVLCGDVGPKIALSLPSLHESFVFTYQPLTDPALPYPRVNPLLSNCRLLMLIGEGFGKCWSKTRNKQDGTATAAYSIMQQSSSRFSFECGDEKSEHRPWEKKMLRIPHASLSRKVSTISLSRTLSPWFAAFFDTRIVFYILEALFYLTPTRCSNRAQ